MRASPRDPIRKRCSYVEPPCPPFSFGAFADETELASLQNRVAGRRENTAEDQGSTQMSPNLRQQRDDHLWEDIHRHDIELAAAQRIECPDEQRCRRFVSLAILVQRAERIGIVVER